MLSQQRQIPHNRGKDAKKASILLHEPNRKVARKKAFSFQVFRTTDQNHLGHIAALFVRLQVSSLSKNITNNSYEVFCISSSYNHVNYTWDNRITFSHLFLRNWDATREVNSYPPSIGPLAIYKKEDLFKTIDYAYNGYIHLDEAIGPYSYANEDNSATDLVLCLDQYKQGIIYGFNESYVFDSQTVESCLNISRYEVGFQLNSKNFLTKNDLNISFSALVSARLMFSLKTINFKAASRLVWVW